MKLLRTALLLVTATAMVMAASSPHMMEMCSESNNNGKCHGLNKDIDTKQHCNLSGSDKCSTSHCCMDRHGDDDGDDDDDHKMKCSDDTNQGKCKGMGKKVDKHRHCFRYGDEKCASSHCCMDHDDGKDHGKHHDDGKDHNKNHGKDHEQGHEKDHDMQQEKDHDKDHGKDHGKDHNKEHEKHHEKDHERDHEKDHDKDHEKDHDKDRDKDHVKDHRDDQGMMCHKDNNQGKCKSLGKKIDEGVHCFRYGDNKCASSHCCKDHDDDKDHGKNHDKDHDDKHHDKDHDGDEKMMCHKDNNQGKCKSLGTKIDEGMHCFRYGEGKCASSHCCK